MNAKADSSVAVDFNHVWEAVSLVLLSYQMGTKKSAIPADEDILMLPNICTLISDITTAVLDSNKLGSVPDRERMFGRPARIYGANLERLYVPKPHEAAPEVAANENRSDTLKSE